jgi:FKBP-type peptidyl-prolyl cis-trans isomerase
MIMRWLGAAFIVSVLAVAGCNGSKGSSAPALTKLEIKDEAVGKGSPAENGDQVWVRYTGKLKDGTVFDSNVGGDKPPFTVTVGAGSVIQGWDKGLVGIREGGKRHLSIPNALAYGAQAMGKVPANADLYFDIEAIKVIKKDEAGQISIEDVKVGPGPALKKGDTAIIDYVATDMTGKEILSSKSEGGPVTFKVGNDELSVSGLEAGILNPTPMRLGGRRKITLPPPYGMATMDGPPSIQTFDVTLKLIK